MDCYPSSGAPLLHLAHSVHFVSGNALDCIFHNNLNAVDGSVSHSGDNRDGMIGYDGKVGEGCYDGVVSCVS